MVPKVVEAILNLPENTHIAVRHTSIILLGELCEWIDSHPQSLRENQHLKVASNQSNERKGGIIYELISFIQNQF